MPAAKLRPVGPRMATLPPVMYSQPWSPTPSTTACAPELRTANRSPTDAAQEGLAAGGAEQDHVAADDVLLGDVVRGRIVGRPDHQASTRQALADVVVGVAVDAQRDALGHERAEAVAGRTVERDVDGAVRKPLSAIDLGHLVAEHGADRAVDVGDLGGRTGPASRCRSPRGSARSAAGPAPCPARGPDASCSTGPGS